MSRPTLRRRGLSIVEVLISLSISSMLLTAIAAAFTASSSAIEMNDRFFRASQAARVSMLQMTSLIRRCQAVQVAANDIHVITDDDRDITYTYDSVNKQLKLTDNTTGRVSVLARNVSNTTFTSDTEPDPKTHISRVVRVSVALTVSVGTNDVGLSSSAAPRRALVY